MGGQAMDSGCGKITLQGEEIPYLLVRVQSRKRLSLLVDGQGRLQVRTPLRATVRQTEQFIRDNAPWVLQRLAHVQQTNAAKPALQEGSLLPFLDGAVQLRYGAEQIRSCFQVGDQLWVADRHRDQPELTELLERWYRKEARRYLPIRLEAWSARMGMTIARLSIRSQKSRWGSCSSKKTISLNWRLICLPTQVGDYVMVHELSHLRHMNHSPEFWTLVASYLPDYVACRRQLRLFLSPW